MFVVGHPRVLRLVSPYAVTKTRLNPNPFGTARQVSEEPLSGTTEEGTQGSVVDAGRGRKD